MKKIAGMACLLTSLLLGGLAQAADLTVTVRGITAQGGAVMVGLFDQASGFPQTPKIGQRVAVNAGTPGQTVVTFKNLAPGRYALSAYHDQNDNQKLDRGLFGIPKERYGFSRDARGTAGPPEFRDAAFELNSSDEQLSLTLR